MSTGVQFLKRLSLIFIWFGSTSGNVIESFRKGELKNYNIAYAQVILTGAALVALFIDMLYQCCKRRSPTSTNGEILCVFVGMIYIVASTILYYVYKASSDIYDKLSIILHLATVVGLIVQSWAWGFYKTGPTITSFTAKAEFA